MSDLSSITAWIEYVKEGGAKRERSAQKIWDRYLTRLIGLARAKLREAGGRAADEEDVVQEAFDAFFRAAQRGQLPKLHDRHDLWPLLVKITERKALDLRRRETRRKRGAGKVRGGSALALDSNDGVDGVASPQDDPQLAALAGDELRWLLEQLSPQLQHIALWRLEGRTLEDISEQLGCVPETVMRKIKLIRATWQKRV